MSVLIEIEKKMSGHWLEVSYESLSGKIGILGTEGSGKSLLLKCIAGIEKPDRGRIQIQGRTVFESWKRTNVKTPKRNVGYLMSDYALFPSLSVENNILCGYRGKRGQGEMDVVEYIRKFGLTGLEDAYPSQLTDLAKFRTAIARVLIGNPQILLLDDPFYGKTGYQKEELKEEFARYQKAFENGYILASADPEEIYSFCEDVIVLDHGRMIASGKTENIFEDPGTVECARLIGCRNISQIEAMDEYHLYASDWGIALRTEKKIKKDITHVGIRTSDLLAVDNLSQNCIPIQILESRRSTKNVKYEGKNAKADKETVLYWESKEQKIPACLYFPPEKLMLLK